MAVSLTGTAPRRCHHACSHCFYARCVHDLSCFPSPRSQECQPCQQELAWPGWMFALWTPACGHALDTDVPASPVWPTSRSRHAYPWSSSDCREGAELRDCHICTNPNRL